ncbi:MAG: hypothetical protein QOJ78_668, partial [Pseudonocardiales bacterium]|nr:hypothetical protein [Pseudonocardiales bacterium]
MIGIRVRLGLLLGCLLLAATACTASHPGSGPSSSQSAARAGQLPLRLAASDARQVITVVAASRSANSAALQAWDKDAKGKWQTSGPEVVAHVGRGGLTEHENESLTATPIGSFTLTQAFGRQ